MILSVPGLSLYIEVVAGSPQWKPLYGQDRSGATFRFLWIFAAANLAPRKLCWRSLLQVSFLAKAVTIAASAIFVYSNSVASLDVLALLVALGVIATPLN
jgi:hypothetical protein